MNQKRILIYIFLIVAGLGWSLLDGPALLYGEQDTASKPLVYLLDVDGSINPALADYIMKGIEKAETDKAAALVIRMDTPGGVLTTTKTIIKSMINSTVPVVVYVGPTGSSAASAGAMITVCADVAAMAPGTNIGAAHPVGGGGEEISKTMSEKVINDITAYIRGIVTEKGRNAEWAEKTIRESVSATAREALDLKAIDLIADSVPELLEKIDGRVIKKKIGDVTLKTKNAQVERIKPGFRFRILDAVANPNVAYILMMLGTLGLIMEMYHPGMIFPGVVGAICLLLALFALQVLPVNYVGFMLIVLSIVLFILELKVTSFGLLAIGAIISLTLGSIMLFEGGETAMRVSWSVIVPTVAIISSFFIFALGLVVRAWRKKPRTGEQGLMGEVGVAITDIHDTGKIAVHGEYWNARSASLVPKGERVRVIRVDKLSVFVIRE
ncbi:MAG: nodulation protein NfeD [Deltaproteobacteria bacterium]|nr:nodulation protein NfeD [Deltaproteobacteria bacterium]